MSINVRQLHVGAHVLVNGKRERVRGIDEDNGLIVRFPAEYVSACDVEPIAITPELLTELGFEVVKTTSYRIYYRKLLSDNRFKGSYIGVTQFISGTFNVSYHTDLSASSIVAGVCRYLHEAEAFLALHNVELITG